MRSALASLTILLILPGCASLQDWEYDTVNSVRTEYAWARTVKNPLRIVYAADYGSGWKAGYLCVTTGGAGHAPTVPPNKYWSPWYQTPTGRQAVADWYAGFQDGVISAERCGAGRYHYVGPEAITSNYIGGPAPGLPPQDLVPGSIEPAPTAAPPSELPPETLPPGINSPAVDQSLIQQPDNGAAGPIFSGAQSATASTIERLPEVPSPIRDQSTVADYR
jgi:hypothetical protein